MIMKLKMIKKYSEKESTIYSEQKLLSVEQNIKRVLNLKTLPLKTPIISICASGGGFRSMLSTQGFLQGLSDIDLIDSIYYMTTLSGSSWGIFPWILSGKNINDFNNDFISRLDEFNNLKNISDLNITKLKNYKKNVFSLYISLLNYKKKKANLGFVDLYGIFLSKLLLSDFNESRDKKLNLSTLMDKIDLRRHPYPIFTATSVLDNYKYEWFEFSPYFWGSKYLDSVVDPREVDINLSLLMGILGSSFSGSFSDILNRFLQLPLSSDILSFVKKTKGRIEDVNWGTKRVGAAYLDNFGYGVKDSPIIKQKKFPVFDGGYISHLPLETVLTQKKKSDIIFVLDNTGILPQTSVLKDTEEQLRAKGYSLPEIDYKKAKTQSLSVFKSNKQGVPAIVYIPLKKDLDYSHLFDPKLEKFCNTTNFFYSKEQAELLVGLSRHTINKNKKQILGLIQELLV